MLRGHRTTVTAALRGLVSARQAALVEPIAMELLAGARSRSEVLTTDGLVSGVQLYRVHGLQAWEDAAAIYRTCRMAGSTPRSQLDCLIAAVAIREDVPVLHADRDFDLIARHTPLRVAAV